jgi:hypothetical protein
MRELLHNKLGADGLFELHESLSRLGIPSYPVLGTLPPCPNPPDGTDADGVRPGQLYQKVLEDAFLGGHSPSMHPHPNTASNQPHQQQPQGATAYNSEATSMPQNNTMGYGGNLGASLGRGGIGAAGAGGAVGYGGMNGGRVAGNAMGSTFRK